MKKNKLEIGFGIGSLALFVLWTLIVNFIDVKPIGPNGSEVGMSTINGFFHNLVGVHLDLYLITDWLGLIPVFTALAFAFLGLFQWIKRKKLLKVDFSILILGLFYILTFVTYLIFEYVVVNYRPVLINGFLEASYPSSTTLLTLCVMPTSMLQLKSRIKNTTLKKCIEILINVFTAFMVIGRLISGVHWITDIFGGVLFSTGLVLIYNGVCKLK
jgi:undecaprenyl-diphosphatase